VACCLLQQYWSTSYNSTGLYGRVDSSSSYHSGSSSYDAPGSSYNTYPVIGSRTPPANCTGSACCIPKCFAEKGSRVSQLMYSEQVQGRGKISNLCHVSFSFKAHNCKSYSGTS
jgi:hypothetical protein